jgi:pimeloyl-ACP methyl ester carboxylesterase
LTASRRVLFLPGASGDGHFWHPVAERLPGGWEKTFFDWPGLGRVPSRPDVKSLDDLARLVLGRAATGQVDLVAQSMGGVVAMTAALACPERVRRIVLTATSAGIDIAPFSPEDWRPEYAQEFPDAASWILTERPDLSARLPSVTAPTLLVWSDADPISPLGVGRRLAGLLPRAELVVLPVAGHMFARHHANLVAPHIERHLSAGEAKVVGRAWSCGRMPRRTA